MSETKYVIQASIAGKWVTRAKPKSREDALSEGYRMLETGGYVDVRVLESYYSHDKGAMSWRQLSIPVPMEIADPPPRRSKRRKRTDEAPSAGESALPPPAMSAAFQAPAESTREEAAVVERPSATPVAPVAPPAPRPTEPSKAEAEFFELMDKSVASPSPPDEERKGPRTLAEIRANLQAQLRKPAEEPLPPPTLSAAPVLQEIEPPPPVVDASVARELSPEERWAEWTRDDAGPPAPRSDLVTETAAGENALDPEPRGPPPDVTLPPFMVGDRVEEPLPSRRAVENEIKADDPFDAQTKGRSGFGGLRAGHPPMESRRGLAEPRPRLKLWPLALLTMVLIAGAVVAGMIFSGQWPPRIEFKSGGLPVPAGERALGAAPASADAIAALDVGDVATVATLLPGGGGANATDEAGVPLLLRAGRQKDDAMVLLLLELGADPKARGALRFSAFEQATIEGLTEAVALMIRKGADPDMADSVDPCSSPLTRAIEQNHGELVSVLIGAGASIKPRADCASGPLDVARDRPAIRGIIEQATGARPETEPVERLIERAVARAVEDNNERTLRALVLGGLPPSVDLTKLKIAANDKWGSGERGLLDHAAYHGQLGIVKELMTLGLRPSPRVLHLAIANYAGEMPGLARILIEGGADPNVVQDGLTPLMRAAIARNADLAKRLLDRGADVGAKDPQDRTAASFVGSTDVELRRLLVR